MDRKILEQKLNELSVPSEFYSLDGDISPDRIVLLHDYSQWEVFYFDERGNRDNEKVFNSESDACDYIFKYFEKQKFTENSLRK